MASNVMRRRGWFLEGASRTQLTNLARASLSFATRREITGAMPVLVKLDLSPVCNLRCTYCVHADETASNSPALAEQKFSSKQRLSLDELQPILEELSGRTMAVALYYIGDPLVRRDLAEVCERVARAGMRSHVSSNYSFHLSDERIEELVTSGLTHLTVCVDGSEQQEYERTRVGGDLALVFDNLERTVAIRKRLGRTHPRIEVQFLRFQHNQHQFETVRKRCDDLGVDQVTWYWGNLHNYTDLPVNGDGMQPKTRGWLPKCTWPWFAMTIRYDGAVLPCCYHRVGEQYREGGDDRAAGDVFTSGVRAVWESEQYRHIRRVVAHPMRMLTSPSDKGTFCEGCKHVHEWSDNPEKTGAETHWEEVFIRTSAGKIGRKIGSE
jgi:MoaA/NifB/PqqE/SkfB family radical SAM enzyme